MITKFVPICSQSQLQKKVSDQTSYGEESDQDEDMKCSEFVPSLSNRGFSITRNGESLNKIFNDNAYLTAFQNTFNLKEFSKHGPNNKEIRKISSEQANHHFTFLVDGNSYKDLKKGKNWNGSTNTEFDISIHTPTDIADMRGWYNKVTSVATGQLTSIRIMISQQHHEESTRGLDVKKRGCRFNDENNELSTMTWYSRINCLFDCMTQLAEKLCNCRPWDYPITNDTTYGKSRRICDYFGSSCFNRVLRGTKNKLHSMYQLNQCKKKCEPDCNETDIFTIEINQQPLDPQNRICDFEKEPYTILEREIKKYMRSLYPARNWYAPPENATDDELEPNILNTVKDILLKKNVTSWNETLAFKTDCDGKLESDLAAVVVSIGSPKFSRIIKGIKITAFDKLATFGKPFILLYKTK